jgi:hypothetical protein
MTLASLHSGIDVPEYATHIPWLITEAELSERFPAGALCTSPGGWLQLRFTILGVNAVFGFNFVSHPEGRLLKVQFCAPAGPEVDEVFAANAATLRGELGEPNSVDLPDCHHLRWGDDRVSVDYSAGQPEDPAAVRTHKLAVFFHAGFPRAWVPPAEPTLAEVKRLLNLLPGIEVSVVRRWSKWATLGLTVRALESVARLAHLSAAANVRFQVGPNDYRTVSVSRSDPTGVLYSLHFPAPWEPEPGGEPTALQILGICLVGDLREQGLIEEDEARRPTMAFNNHTVLED